MIQKCSIWRVASVFFDEPSQEHYLHEVSKKAKLAHTSVRMHLVELLKQGVIVQARSKRGTRTFPIYRVNIEDKRFRTLKRVHNLYQITQCGIVEAIRDILMPHCIVLFGSFSRGEDTEDSDIDLFVEAKERAIDIAIFEKKLHRNVQLHFKERIKQIHPELRNNILNGIVLSGYLEAV